MTLSQALSLTRDESGRLRKAPIAVLLLGVLLLPVALSYTVSSPPDASRRDTAIAQLVEADGVTRSNDQARQLSLPDPWDQSRRGFGGVVDYRFAVDARKDGPRQAVFVPRVKTYCDVLLNGELIYSDSGVAQVRGSNRTILAELPAAAIIDGPNALTIRVHGYANDGSGLSEVYIGRLSDLRDSYTNRRLIQDEFLKLSNWIVLAMCVPFVLLWLRDPKNSQFYGLFAIGAIIFAVRNFHRQFDVQVLPMGLTPPLVAASLGWSALPLYIFLTRYVGWRNATFERSIIAFTAIGTVLLFLVPAWMFSRFDAIAWRLPILLVGIYCMAVLAIETFRAPSTSRLLMACALAAQVAPAVHDLLWLLHVISYSVTQWFPLSFPFLLLVMGLALADDVATAKFALRNANADLELKIAAARQELDELYEKKRKSDAEAVTLEERHRLMRDMHDGVGTHLSLLLSGLEGGRLSSSEITNGIQASLDELRLLIDARSASTETLVDALSNLRHRLAPRLASFNVNTRWEIDDGTEELKLGAESTLHVLRIVQECLNNAVRHGQATEITFHIGLQESRASTADKDGGHVYVSIRDNGVGPDAAPAASRGNGQGLKSIAVRTQSLGASFSLKRVGDETVAMLVLAEAEPARPADD
jgi:signal transduction histidine kinase